MSSLTYIKSRQPTNLLTELFLSQEESADITPHRYTKLFDCFNSLVANLMIIFRSSLPIHCTSVLELLILRPNLLMQTNPTSHVHFPPADSRHPWDAGSYTTSMRSQCYHYFQQDVEYRVEVVTICNPATRQPSFRTSRGQITIDSQVLRTLVAT